MKRFVRTLFTGRDNSTWDLGRVLWGLGCLAMLIFTGHDVFYNHKFNPEDFGIGFGSLLFGGGGSIWIKRLSEPKENKDGIDNPDTR